MLISRVPGRDSQTISLDFGRTVADGCWCQDFHERHHTSSGFMKWNRVKLLVRRMWAACFLLQPATHAPFRAGCRWSWQCSRALALLQVVTWCWWGRAMHNQVRDCFLLQYLLLPYGCGSRIKTQHLQVLVEVHFIRLLGGTLFCSQSYIPWL